MEFYAFKDLYFKFKLHKNKALDFSRTFHVLIKKYHMLK